MPRRETYQDLRSEARIAARVAARDRTKRVVIQSLTLAVLFQSVGPAGALPVLGAVLLAEAVLLLACHRLPPEEAAPLSAPRAVAIWLFSLLSIAATALPALVLARTDSMALRLAGVIWLCGGFVYTAYRFALLPRVALSMLVPLLVIGAMTLHSALSGPAVQGTTLHGIVAGSFLLMLVLEAFQTEGRQRAVYAALSGARREAAARLREIEERARHDGLTDLLNRPAFDLALGRLLDAQGKAATAAVLIVDLDGFKPINDSYSHEAGDLVLRHIASRLRRLVGAEASVARMGGDEFAILLPDPGDAAAALHLGRAIVEEVRRPIGFGNRKLRVGASVGIALTGPGRTSVSALCAAADQAMYKAKADFGGRAVLFDPDGFSPRPTLEDRARLEEAMRGGAIEPHYQPKVDLATQRVVGFEALARWNRGAKGLLMPAAFLPQVNDFGLQGAFLMHVASCVVADIEAMLDDGLSPGQVSINLPEVALATHSGREDLAALFRAHPRVRGHVTLEVTEDVFIARAGDRIREAISQFRAMGLRVALDDFGTGFASFQHLRQLEFDELKIDTSFVADLGRDAAAETIVESILHVAGGLGVSVVAEGVETEAQARDLRRLGCPVAQGFLYGGALPIARARDRLTPEAPSLRVI